MSSMFAIVGTFLFEIPFIGLEKVVFQRNSSSENEQKSLISDEEKYIPPKSYDSHEQTMSRSETDQGTKEMEMYQK